jgi:putative transposase
LLPAEKSEVLTLLHSERFVDKSPAQVHAILLEEGRFVASPRTMYRILDANKEVRERRDQLVHPRRAVPVLVARKPNHVWSWDVSAPQQAA